MKPGKSADASEEIVQVHTAARSPSPKNVNKTRSRSRSVSRKLSNGHTHDGESLELTEKTKEPSDQSKTRDNWIKSEQESLDIELPIHEQLKQGILGFVEQEIKKSDKNPSFVFYSHDPNVLDDKLLKASRPSSSHKEKRSPSYRRKKRHSSKHRDRELQEFEIPASSLSALEKVDDYLKEYNKDEVVTLSGELEIEANDVENNNGSSRELQHKPRKTRRKARDEHQDSNANSRDSKVSPKVFKTGSKSKGAKPVRPTDLTSMLQSLESSMPYHDQYIDNPFSSPSPLTSPNDERLGPFGSRRPDKLYMQGGGTFTAVSRDRILESQEARKEEKYLRLGELTPLDVAMAAQRAWRGVAAACHGVLGGLALMHLLLISYTDGLDGAHLAFHAAVTTPYVAAYYFFCVLCLLSVLDRLDIAGLELTNGLQPYFQPIVLAILYTACLLVSTAARTYDELMVHHYPTYPTLVGNGTGNVISNITSAPTIPSFYHTWTHFSIWRAVLSILGLVYFVISNPQDLVYLNLSKLLQFKQSLQSIG